MESVRLVATPPPAWGELRESDPRATLYLDPRWMDAITRAYPRYRPGWLVSGGASPDGVLPLVSFSRAGLEQVLSLPFGTHGGPVLAPACPEETVRALARAWRARVSGARVLRFELTVFSPTALVERVFEEELAAHRVPFHTHVIDLTPGVDTLWNRDYDKETRTCVRRAEREGVTVAVETGAEAVAILHRLHAAQAQSWPGTRPHTAEALAAVADSLGGDARVWVARREGVPLTACLTLYHRGREVHPWVSGAAVEARPVRAYHLLMHVMIRDACERGYAEFQFGGSAGNRGIEYFKESMGARPRPVLRYFREAAWYRRLRGSRG